MGWNEVDGGDEGRCVDGGGVDAPALASVSPAESCRDLGSTKASWVTQGSGRVPASDGNLTADQVEPRTVRCSEDDDEDDDDNGRQARSTASVSACSK